MLMPHLGIAESQDWLLCIIENIERKPPSRLPWIGVLCSGRRNCRGTTVLCSPPPLYRWIGF
uniref:Uncharacterized protein n=1 Tax=Arundo donax TaxID=35708 RepID=A0A0A9A0Q4_ARUDO